MGQALTSTFHDILDRIKRYYQKWISIKTVNKIQGLKSKKTAIKNSRTRSEKFKAHNEHTEANTHVRKRTRADKRKYAEGTATTVEKAEIEGNLRQLYDRTMKLVGKYVKPKSPGMGKEGKPITVIQVEKHSWVEHSEEHLNKTASSKNPQRTHRRWKSIEYTLRISLNCITRHVLTCNSEEELKS